MRKEIESKLKVIQIEAKEARKKKLKHILIIVILDVVLFLIPYYYPQFGFIWVIFVIIFLFGGIYVLVAIGTWYQPLKQEFYAFQKIARAIEILEKSKEPIAYEEAYRCLKKAYKNLDFEIEGLSAWYAKINETLERFHENLQLIVLPATANFKINIGHLEEFALALVSMDSKKIEAVNEMLESTPNYEKIKPPPRKMEKLVKTFRESKIRNILYSLVFGYGLILIACLIYVVFTQQDFMTFARERPEIVIGYGLLASGITSLTIWKIR